MVFAFILMGEIIVEGIKNSFFGYFQIGVLAAFLNEAILIKGIKRAIDYLKKNRKFLDKINVFPVEDKDTGDNLFETFNQAFKKCEKIKDDDFLIRFSEEMFFSARGNSGIIISQFFIGFVELINGKKEIDFETFVKAFEQGRKRAYEAVSEPKEGTILTAIRETEFSLKKYLSQNISFYESLKLSLKECENVVLKTKEMLKELRDKNVPDAGAYGFYFIYKGIVDSYESYRNRSYN